MIRAKKKFFTRITVAVDSNSSFFNSKALFLKMAREMAFEKDIIGEEYR